MSLSLLTLANLHEALPIDSHVVGLALRPEDEVEASQFELVEELALDSLRIDERGPVLEYLLASCLKRV